MLSGVGVSWTWDPTDFGVNLGAGGRAFLISFDRTSTFFLTCNGSKRVHDIFNAHMNETLLRLEKATRLGPTYVARLLGIAYSTYAQYRSGRRPLQLYHERHIEALSLMPSRSLRALIERHLND